MTLFHLLLVTALFPFSVDSFTKTITDNSSTKINQDKWENSSIQLMSTSLSVRDYSNKAVNKQLLLTSSSKLSALLGFFLNSISRSFLNPGTHVLPRFVLNPLPRDKESYYTPPQVITNRGYPVEIHHVTTDDGYILELHRIPAKSKGARIVFFQHGVFESSGTWFVNPSERSLPLILADLGYDIWLGNVRGNRYSRRHAYLNPRFRRYWQFSLGQVGEFDTPAMINYVLTQGNQTTLIYIADSMGAAMFSIAMIKHPELNTKIERMIGFGPQVSAAHFSTPIFRSLCRVYQPAILLYTLLTWTPGLLLDNQGLMRLILRLVCEQTELGARICRLIIINILTGFNVDNINLNLIPHINSESMKGTSDKTILQFCQNFNAGQVFQAFDYGTKGNLKHYGSTKPLIYDLKKVIVPVYLFAGSVDRFAPFQDVLWLSTQVSNLKHFEIIEGYNHADFLWGNDVKERVYDKVVAMLPPP